jgi:hypothetical protein
MILPRALKGGGSKAQGTASTKTKNSKINGLQSSRARDGNGVTATGSKARGSPEDREAARATSARRQSAPGRRLRPR